MRSFAIAALLLIVAAPAPAGEDFTAVLNGANAGNSSTATGFALFTLSDDQLLIEYNVTYTGLLGTESGAHVHAPATGVIFDLGLGNPKVGAWQFPTPTRIAQLRNGELRVFIHSLPDYTDGEIIGTLKSALTPVAPTTWGKIKALYATR